MKGKLSIAIDARWIFSAPSGVGVYTRNLIRHLPLLDEESRYVLLFDDEELMERELRATHAGERKNVSAELLPYSVFSLRNQLALPRKLKELGIDVFHSPNFMIPLAGRKPKTIVTIHDLIPLLFPHYTGRSKKRRLFALYKCIMRRVAGRADAILADSECTRKDILKTLNIPGDKVHRLYIGVDKRFSPGDARGHVRERFGISGKLLLCVGRQDPYKNVITSVKALRFVRQRRKDLDCQMLVVGERDVRYPEVSEYISRQGLSGKAIMTDYLDDDDLVAAYREADALVHLSLYEGFGLPPLEAMACGTPVVSSDRSSLPEILGDAALFTDPCNPSQAADNIIAVLTDEGLRRRLVEKGREQAARYRWEDTAGRLVEIYRMLGGRHRNQGARG
jgi:glycosyltransferase involved in cell wall biosynthesis